MYDFIIAGGGAAGLSLAYYLTMSPLSGSRVLVVDGAKKDANDRTWCFWSDAPSALEKVVYGNEGAIHDGTDYARVVADGREDTAPTYLTLFSFHAGFRLIAAGITL